MSQSSHKYSLTARIFIGMIAGIIIGALLQFIFDDSGDLRFSIFSVEVSTYSILVEGIFSTLGQIFISSLKMLVVPLVLVSLICGTSSLSDPSKLGRLGIKSISFYILTTGIAVSLAIMAGLLVAPGEGLNLQAETTYAAKEAPSLSQVIVNMFPSNPINALAQGNMLQIIVFAVLLGVAMAMTGDAGKRVAAFFEDLNTVIMRLVTIIMNLAPYGVFVLMAKLFASIELGTIVSLVKYFMVVLVVLIIHGLVTYSALLKVFSGLSPVMLLTKMRDAALFAFSTSSSSATLPVTMETARNKLGVGKSVSSFTLPLGATINMDGTAIMQGVATVFIAQVYAVDLTLGDYVMVVLTATLASVGTAGVPGVGLIMLAMVLQQVNLPVEGIALIIGVDRLLDMTRTAVNITGDCTVACIIAKSEGELDQAVFDDPNAGSKQEDVDFEHFDRNA
ncbi:MAG: dicarboxylate/amino acid:cation symporter [Aestuariibacter sp.]|jgi:Na+/H+-dicarboxylate symporter|uniref:dicarboxylate/amino acid:cation symporter n=1 Tax=Marisediminitalea aggregata TaxID=634436 RepID=UPI0020CEFEDA|nr:dicarboxylate/amino acid:cation symporter [Marisediminitalea aggregata]MCP3866393.1 dicarboxylate/amino acid:cation symporter [Aestuariibacter sp.]MCP4238036.1 dicarboxylate/amino acid:cation symporter [Aestuariibacter sp.]MCP4529561.1 dicarboxylate/amino acid:cation symporter [Aestuariibacter sp.]MCP4947909.1 dicarboxylate/amino acid:cation symporter [Aestuariibacter sp.]MCP9478986.1 dicarboxylate/amino acid:cation symporter [Marisediminitalea aggregata]